MPTAIYPWDVWFRRERFSLQRGRHYQCSTGSMIQQLRNAASVREMPIRIIRTNRGLVAFVLTDLAKAIREVTDA